MGARNLLVIDWDYFFPQPLDGGDYTRDLAGLYDWSHAESPFMIDAIWPLRAAGFIERGLPLPRCEGYKGFWDRFTIARGTRLMYADSNSYATLLRPSQDGRWDSVWLFDAHHDCGYRGTLDQWRRTETVSCEDWMVTHAELGSALHVRYPPWKTRAMAVEPEPLVPVDRCMDDGAPIPVTFDAVFLCRSGAWVPPWCDDQFVDMIESYGFWAVNIDEQYDQMQREFDHPAAEAMATQVRKSIMEWENILAATSEGAQRP